MLSAKQAEALILHQVQPLNPVKDLERVDLLSAGSRVLATNVASELDFPYWDNSAMDGYAVRFTDIEGCSAVQPAQLQVVIEIPAGTEPQQTLQLGQAARIFTGSMLPLGADTVVIQEHTHRQADQVQILKPPAPQANIRFRGEFYQAGTPLLPQGTVLSAPDIAVLATVQCTQIPVYRRPVVAILSTGTELVTPEQTLRPGQIIDSNQYALATLVRQAGAEPRLLGMVGDSPAVLEQAIAQACATADLVISSGGVSVGDYDYVDQVLQQLGAEIHIRSVAVKPGKPLTVATFSNSSGARSILYFGLPGNPVSALVGFWRFVQPAIRKLSGAASWQLPIVQATTHHALKADTRRETYLWGQLCLVDGAYEFALAQGSHSSGNLINLAQTNALAMLPCDRLPIAVGEQVQVLQVGPVV